MDKRGDWLDISNLGRAIGGGVLDIPVYGLYGERGDLAEREWIHSETVPARSRIHGYEIKPHRHASLFQILHITNGSAEARIDLDTVRVAAPVALTVPPLAVHGYRFSHDIDGSVVTVFEGRMDGLLAALPGARRRFAAAVRIVGLRDPDDASAVHRALEMVGREHAGHGPGRMAIMEACVTVALARLDRAAARQSGDGAEGWSAPPRRAQQFRALLERHFRAERAVAFYAAEMGVTPTHLGRICHAAFGASPLALINRRVLLEAQRSLVFTVSTVSEIAATLGFADPAYFTRFFTREAGVSPTGYRRRSLAGDR